MLKKITAIILLVLIGYIFMFAQTTDNNDKFTTTNVMLKKVYFTKYGLITEYFLDGQLRQAYLPDKFFEEGIAIKVPEEDAQITPQMNVIYKNGEQFKVKLYLPTSPEGDVYPLIEFVPEELAQKFKNTEKLDIYIYNRSSN